jgi:hypothetical protein
MLLAVFGLLVAAGSLTAQEDFRSSDPGRPLRVEDAIPLKLREWEFELGLRTAAREEGSSLGGVFELKSGLFRNGHVGVEIEAGVVDIEGGTASGIEAVHGHALIQLARETPSLPAFAVRAEAGTPGTGSIGRSDWAAGALAIATRSIGRGRVHANGGYGVLSQADGGDFWDLGVGFDYPIGLFSRAILGALSAEIPVDAGVTRVWLEVGSRWQISNLNVLDVGLSTRLDQWNDGNANIELVVGISRIFGFAGLTKVAPYPNPTLR